MARALELAARGIGQVSPSPLVGCVVLDATGNVAGEGFYIHDRVKHAEMSALEEAGGRARGGAAYVSLEPHAHMGRTPPCTEALIEAGIARVVATIEDPNPLVSGRGFTHLRQSGIEVATGLLAREASRLNEKYIHAMREGTPFVHLKLACSLDGRIATRTGDARWITGETARARVHALRHEYDAILIGAGTALRDDPLLTDRTGLPRRRPLARVLLDERLQLSADSKMARSAGETPVVVFTSRESPEEKASELEKLGVEIVRTRSGGRDVVEVLGELYRRNLQSVFIEGGAHVAGRFLESGLVNKASFFVAPIIIGGDAKSAVGGAGALTISEAHRFREVEITLHGVDVEITGYLKGRDR